MSMGQVDQYTHPIVAHLAQRILLLDGAMGTMIQQHNLEESDFRGTRFQSHPHSLKGNNDILNLTRPDIIQSIHEAYLLAGADILETNTFSGTTFAQADYHLEDCVYDINYEGARLARAACDKITAQNPDKPRWVAGVFGPTNKTASLSPKVNDPGYRAVTFDELVEAYSLQCKALHAGGADLFLVETIFDTLNAKAALFAIMEFLDQEKLSIPVMVSGTITDASGRTLSGQTAEAFLISVSHAPLLSIGFNCALGAAQLQPHVAVLASKSNLFVSAYPNAGLPNAFGHYDETPSQMARLLKSYLEDGLVNIVGGCCGTTPAHIAEMASLCARYSPRKVDLSKYRVTVPTLA